MYSLQIPYRLFKLSRLAAQKGRDSRHNFTLKSELRALRTGHLSTSEVRLPWTPEEKLRHESNGHSEYDDLCVKSA